MIPKRTKGYLKINYFSALIFWLLATSAYLVQHYFGSRQPGIEYTNSADLIALIVGLVATLSYVIAVCSVLYSLIKLKSSSSYLHVTLSIVLLFSYFAVFYIAMR